MRHLTKPELHELLAVAKKHSTRNWLMILVAYWHGLRATEVVTLTPANIRDGEITVQRLKGSCKTIQPLITHADSLLDERAALEKLVRETTGRLFPITRMQFWRIMQRYGAEAHIAQSKCHPHITKHSIASHGILKAGIHNMQRHLGHRNMNSTAAYLYVDDETATKTVAAAVGA